MNVSPETVERILIAIIMRQPVADDTLPPEHVQADADGVCVARLAWEDGAHRVVALACHRAAHGVRDEYAKVQKMIDDLTGIHLEAEDCNSCGGTGWLPAADRTARTVASMGLMVRRFRGVVLPEDLTAVQAVAHHMEVGGVMDILSTLKGG